MNKGDLLKAITTTYQKFGWTLRRVLLTPETQCDFALTLQEMPAHVLIENSDINAIWFSRRSDHRETWEVRLLSSSPFALLQTFDQNTLESERADARQTMLEKLRANAGKFNV